MTYTNSMSIGYSNDIMCYLGYDLRLGLILTKNLFFVFQLKKMLHVYVCNFIEYNSTSKHRKEVRHERICLRLTTVTNSY